MRKKTQSKYSQQKEKLLKEPIYNRQETETDAAWNAFCVFRDMPDDKRTITAVSLQLQKSFTLCRRWAKMWSWQRRLVAWQNEQLTDELEALKAQRIKKAKENLTIASAWKSKFAKWLKNVKDEQLQEVHPRDMMTITDTVIKMERQTIADLLESQQIAEAKAEGNQIIIRLDRE